MMSPLSLRALVASVATLVFAALAAPASAGFTDRTVEAQLVRHLYTWSTAFVDIERDGDLDLYVGHHALLPELYRNDGTGTFALILPQPWSGPSDRHGVLALPLEDKFPDLLITHGGVGGAGTEANELFRNEGDGLLIPLSGDVGGLADPAGRSRCASGADANGDRRVDIWIGKGPGESPNSLFLNVGPYSFVDVAEPVGLAEMEGAVGGLWGDWDLDGDPDLFVGGEEFSSPSRLWRNQGGFFTDATSVFSPPPPTVSGADWGDWDDDGDLDLAVCDGHVGLFDVFVEGDTLRYFFNTRWGEDGVDGLTIPSGTSSGADTLWGKFEFRGVVDTSLLFLGPDEVTPAAGTEWIPLTDEWVGEPAWEPGVDRGTFVWRQSPGGPWEVRCSTPFVSADTFNGWIRGALPIGGVTGHGFEDSGFVPGGPRLWRNDGGALTEITASVGLEVTMVNPRDLSWVDFDADGDLDLHVVDQGTSETLNAPDAMFRNDGGTFTEVAAAEGLLGDSDGLGDGAVWGDVDRDGDLDVYVAQGAGPRALGGTGPSLFLRNDGGGSSVALELLGNLSGIAAIGTKVTARIGPRTLTRWLHANSWRGFQDAREIHLGLGTASQVDTLRVEWPSGIVDVYLDVAPGYFVLDEGTTVLDARVPGAAGPGWTIEAVRPQPARHRQTIVLGVDRPLRLAVDVYDAAGRRVRSLHEGPVAAGANVFEWDGRDGEGTRVAAGVYFFRIDDGRTSRSAKSVRVR